MKKLFLKQLVSLLMLSSILFACSKSDDGPGILLPKTDGFYVYGDNTIATSPSDQQARMTLAVLDPTKGPKVSQVDNVFGKYLYIGANSKIGFVNVVAGVGTIYGADGGGTVDSAKVVGNSPIKDNVVYGKLKAQATEINITEEGLYYAYVNFNTSDFIIMKVRANLIGDPTNWGKGILLPVKSASKDVTVFEATNVLLKDGQGYRYRMNDGWAVYEDDNIIAYNSLGVHNWDEARAAKVNSPVFEPSNMPQVGSGYYTINLTYTASTGVWSESKTKTKDIYQDYTIGIIGDATAAGTFAGDGTGGYGLEKPTKSGSVYTWTWSNVTLLKDKEFVLLQDAKWNNFLVAYWYASIAAGTAITNGDVINAHDAPVNSEGYNFHVVTEGAYDVILTINADTDVILVTINNH